MLLSIITINLNNAAGLSSTIQSVVEQSYTGFEYIVIDGGSLDGSVGVIQQHASRINHWVSESDAGIYDAMNKGIALAKGKYIMFLNSGDVIAGTIILEASSRQMLQMPDTDIFFGDTYLKRKDNTLLLHVHPKTVNVDFLRRHQLNHQSSFISAALFKQYGFYPITLKFASDHWLYLKSVVDDKQFVHMDMVLVIYDHSGLSIANMDKYRSEADMLWLQIVPAYARQLVDTIDGHRRTLGFKLVKAAYFISEKIERYRKRRI